MRAACIPRHPQPERVGREAGSDEFRLLLAGFLLFFSFSLTLLYAFDIRPVVYYVVMAVMATIISWKSCGPKITQGKVIVVLMQIMALSLNLSWGITLKYFEFIGRTDILLHSSYVKSIVQLGYVTSVFDDYQPFPLWHIMNAGIDMVGGGCSRPTRSCRLQGPSRSPCCPSSFT